MSGTVQVTGYVVYSCVADDPSVSIKLWQLDLNRTPVWFREARAGRVSEHLQPKVQILQQIRNKKSG